MDKKKEKKRIIIVGMPMLEERKNLKQWDHENLIDYILELQTMYNNRTTEVMAMAREK